MAHAPAILFKVQERGFIREGYHADLVLVNPQAGEAVNKTNVLYKCGWSPFEGHQFSHSIHSTFVNGNCVYSNGQIHEGTNGHRLSFLPR
jgi:dihydroorotase